MDSLRQIIAASSQQQQHPVSGSDSGIEACGSQASGSQAQPMGSDSGGGGGGAGGGHTTSHSEATSALHDLSSDVNELLADDAALTEDDASVADGDEASFGGENESGDVDGHCIEDLLALQINVAQQEEANSAVANGGNDENNRQFGVQRLQMRDRLRMASKEEKQRQNEEIVIMESSSISSETGSWESVFPQQRTPTAAAPATIAVRTLGDVAGGVEVEVIASGPAKIPAPIRTTEHRLPDFAFSSSKPAPSSAGACFIDASSLMDDTELYASNSQLAPQLPEVCCRGPKPEAPETNEIVGDLPSPNMSDEQKLMHRVVPDSDRNVNVDYDIKDQFSSEPSSLLSVCRLDATDLSEASSLFTDSVPLSSEPLQPSAVKIDSDARHRQDLERKQGHFLFRNSIQHYSGNVLQPVRNTVFGIERDEAHSDMSLPSVFSTGSSDLGQPRSFDTSAVSIATSLNSRNCSYSTEPESGFYPDTPHNSIIHVDVPLVPVTIGYTPAKTTDLITANDRMRPGEVEGPATTVFRPPFDSPSVRRKTETCPILSGGLLPEDIHDDEPKVGSYREKSLSASMNSWVVDMSDCRSPKTDRRRLDSVSSGSSSVFNASSNGCSHSLDTTRSTKPAHVGFFVDMTQPPTSSVGANVETGRSAPNCTTAETAEKKNIFSMFIDFGDDKSETRRKPSVLSSRLQRTLSESPSNASDIENDRGTDTSNQVIRRTPTVARRTLDPKARHSWTEPNKPASVFSEKRRVEYTSSQSMPNGDHNASGSGIMSILDKLPIISQTTSMSVDSPQSPFDDHTVSCSKSLSVYSNISGKSVLSLDEQAAAAADAQPLQRQRRRRQDVDINETFDKSSRSSLPEEQLSTDTSPITDTDDVTFQNELDMDPVLNTILERDSSMDSTQIDENSDSQMGKSHTMESLQAIIERQQKLLLEPVAEEPQASHGSSAFVKLSDMDKPAQKFELHSTESSAGLSKSVGSGASRIERLFGENGRPHRSPRNSVHPMSRSAGTAHLNNLASSSDNLRSLSRLFPHLSKDLSSSMPSEMQMNDAALAMHKSPINEYNELHDLSAASSVTSSISRSAIDSADESSVSYRQPRRLGEDLLKMFLQEIATDVSIEVAGRRMRAHKCILRSRCQYFAAILAGNWVHAAGNVITVPGYSFGAVHFALCHIYSGAAHPPEGISLIELAALADLLGLEGLKEVTTYALRTHYCHNFHKPCSGCIDGVLQVFPVTLNHGLDDLYRKCLRWTCRHYVKVWPTRAFSQLPVDLMARCAQHLLAHLNTATVLDTILDCDYLLTLVAPSRWAITTENTVRDILDTAHTYLSDHFASLIASDVFLALGQDQSWNISRLEHLLLRTASTLSAEQVCRSVHRLGRLHAVILYYDRQRPGAEGPLFREVLKDGLVEGRKVRPDDGGCEYEDIEWHEDFKRLVCELKQAVHLCLLNQWDQATGTRDWQRLDAGLKQSLERKALQARAHVHLEHQQHQQLHHSQQRLLHKNPDFYQRLRYSGSGSHALSSRPKELLDLKLAMQSFADEPRRPAERPTTLHIRGSAHSRQRHDGQDTEYHRDAELEASRERDCLDLHRRLHGKSFLRKPQQSALVPDVIPIGAGVNRVIQAAVNQSPLSQRRSRTAASNQLRPAVGGKQRVTSAPVASNKQPLSSSENSDCAVRVAPRNNKSLTGKPLGSKPAAQSLALAAALSDIDLSVDSLGGSMHSSIRSTKSSNASQSSLNAFNSAVRANNAAKTAKALALKQPQLASLGVAAPTSRLRKPAATTAFLQRPNAISLNGTSCSGSTSAASTAKSSRLPSVASAKSSPREAARAAPDFGGPAVVRRSFLSVRSKEILASKRHTAPPRAESQPAARSGLSAATGIPTSVNGRSPLAVNKSRSTSAMPSATKSPAAVAFSTTLHLRRTAKVDAPTAATIAANRKSAPLASTGRSTTATPAAKFVRSDSTRTSIARTSRIAAANRTQSPLVAGATIIPRPRLPNAPKTAAPATAAAPVDEDRSPEQRPLAATRVESKLERSSTFCKESSTLDMAELQVIE